MGGQVTHQNQALNPSPPGYVLYNKKVIVKPTNFKIQLK